jgi:hypothetical protein
MGFQFTFLKQMDLKLANVLDAEPFWGAMEIGGEPLDGTDVGTCGSLRVITALEFLEHLVSKLGHRDLLVTQIYLAQNSEASPGLDA